MSFGSGISWWGTRHRQGFWPRINCSQMKLPNFGSPSSDRLSKIGRHLSNKVVLKLKSPKNAFYKKGALKLIFFNEFFLERFGWFLTQKIHFESPKLALFDKLSPDGDSKSGNFIWLKLILGQKPCLCRVQDHEIPLPKLIYYILLTFDHAKV